MDFGRKELRHDKHAAGSLDERYDPDGEAGPYDAAIAATRASATSSRPTTAADDERAALEAAAARRLGDRPGRQRQLPRGARDDLLERLSGDEIAERLGITMDNVYARRSRGVQATGEDPP